MAEHNELGKWGEGVAVETLTAAGYAIRETNWRLSHYEIDIIATKGDRMIFVEVKTRSSDFVDPVDAVDKRKMAFMVRSANAYMQHYDLPYEVQFDIIAITGTQENYTVEHIPDAFYPPLRNCR